MLDMVNSSRTFSSYNYPNTYPRGIECLNLVMALSNGSIHITVVTFDTERSFDTLEIGHGSNPNDRRELLTLTGTVVPNSATFQGPSVWMRFRSDDDEERSGYRLDFEWISPTKSGIPINLWVI